MINLIVVASAHFGVRATQDCRVQVYMDMDMYICCGVIASITPSKIKATRALRKIRGIVW